MIAAVVVGIFVLVIAGITISTLWELFVIGFSERNATRQIVRDGSCPRRADRGPSHQHRKTTSTGSVHGPRDLGDAG